MSQMGLKTSLRGLTPEVTNDFSSKTFGTFRYSLYICSRNVKTSRIMESRTINVLVNVPKSYRIDLLQQQLTAYAQQLIAASKSKAKTKRKYRHEALCGIFNSDATEEQLVEDYLQEKYNL